MGTFQSADELFSAGTSGFKFDYVDTPEWGEDSRVRIRELNALQRAQFDRTIATVTSRVGGKKTGGTEIEYHAEKVRVELVYMACVDDTDQRLFNTPEQKLKLGNQSAAVIDRIYRGVLVLSGLAEDDTEEGDDGLIETTQGESDPTLEDSSSGE
jgi:hypothetical protein